MRRDLTTIARRVEKLRQRARLVTMPPLVLIDVGTWPEPDRIAYANGDEETRSALETKHAGPLPDAIPGRPGAAVAVVVNVPLGWDEPDLDETEAGEPGRISPDRLARLREEQAEIARRAAEQIRFERGEYPADEPDPRDPNPTGSPDEVLYEKAGYPVTRREHQANRARALELLNWQAQEQRRATEARSSYTSW